jgi:hypothetical protein
MTTTDLKNFRSVLEARQTELGNGIGDREALAVDTSPDQLDRVQHAAVRTSAKRPGVRSSHPSSAPPEHRLTGGITSALWRS